MTVKLPLNLTSRRYNKPKEESKTSSKSTSLDPNLIGIKELTTLINYMEQAR